jgi:thiamine-phosphate pyrophosphorylase
MQLRLLTPEKNTPNETEIINTLFGLGLHKLHLRKPHFGATDYRSFISQIDLSYHTSIVIHGNYELYTDLQLGGIHLNSNARDKGDTWKEIQEISSTSISTSFHSWQEIEENTFEYGSVFISPLFNSISKAGYMAATPTAGIIETRKKLNENQKFCPEIIGLGGIDKNAIPILQQYRYDGAAMLGAVWTAPDPVVAFRDIMALMNSIDSPHPVD